MTRPAGQNNLSKQMFRLAVLCLLILALSPVKWTWWTSSFSSVATLLFAPIGQPVSYLAGLARGPADPGDPEEVRRLSESAETWKTMYLQSEAANERLQAQISDMKLLVAFNTNVPVKTILAGVYSSASDVSGGDLKVRAGDRDGVRPNAVAVVARLQLLGRVTAVEERTCSVLPITAKASGDFRARVMTDDRGGGPATVLTPVGNGTFRGDVEYQVNTANEPLEPVVGHIVRLTDERWPQHAQMLIVGVVEDVSPSDKNPKRKRITVRPTLDRMEQSSEVILRVAAGDESIGPKNGGGR